jgi:hypothetical protein
VIEQGRRDRSLTGEVGGSDFVGGFEGVGFHAEDSEGGAGGGEMVCLRQGRSFLGGSDGISVSHSEFEVRTAMWACRSDCIS